MKKKRLAYQIAGTDGKLECTNAFVLSTNKIKVCNKVINPALVCCAWYETTNGANLKNKERLPTSPLTTNN